MARVQNPYKKFGPPGSRRTFFAVSGTRSRLWLGEDHLLLVESTMTSEEYRRFYFRDIEAIVIRRTIAGLVWNWVLGGLLVATVGPFLLAWNSDRTTPGYLITAGVLALFWGVILLVHVLRGPSCQTHIRTAVQTELLATLARVPAARKALARLQPLILGAQGQATPDELAVAPWMAARG
jgi:hypothetical protein